MSPLDQDVALAKRFMTSKVLQISPDADDRGNGQSEDGNTFECVLALPQKSSVVSALPAVVLYPHTVEFEDSLTLPIGHL